MFSDVRLPCKCHSMKMLLRSNVRSFRIRNWKCIRVAVQYHINWIRDIFFQFIFKLYAAFRWTCYIQMDVWILFRFFDFMCNIFGNIVFDWFIYLISGVSFSTLYMTWMLFFALSLDINRWLRKMLWDWNHLIDCSIVNIWRRCATH